MDHTADRTRPAALLAAVGSFLLTAAAVSFVSARWDRFGPGSRFAVLLLASGLLLALTHALRKVAPATTRALDVLVAALAPVDVAALAIVVGAPWPLVLLVAGPSAVLAAETLRRHDPSPVTEFGTAVGGILGFCGLAAALGIAVAPLIAGAGLLAGLVGPWRRERLVGPMWAALAGLAPALRVLDDVAFTGDGTLREIGLLDAAPWSATLVAGTLAAVALALSARARHSPAIGLLAAASVLATAGAMWAEHQPPKSLLVLAVALCVAFAELALMSPVARLNRALTRPVTSGLVAANGVLTAWMLLAAIPDAAGVGASLGLEWPLATLALAFAWVVADLRAERPGLAAPTWGVAANLVALALFASTEIIAGSVGLVGGIVVLLTARPGRSSLAWTLGVIAPLFLTGDLRMLAFGAAIGSVIVVVASLVARHTYDRLLGTQALVGALVPIAAAGFATAELLGWAAGAMVVAVLCWAGALLVEGPLPGPALAARAIGLSVLTSAVSDRPSAVAVALVVLALASAAHALLLARWSSWILGGWSLLLAAAVLTIGRASEPSVVFSLVVAGIGLAVIAWGADIGSKYAMVAGGGVIWWAELVGLAAADIASLEPYLYPLLVIGGLTAYREYGIDAVVGRWSAVALPLAVAIVVGFGQRVDSGHGGHTLVLGAAALALAIAGAMRSVHPALVLGAATTVAVGSFEALEQTIGIESWSWLVVSGATALTVAALLEVVEVDPNPVGSV